MPHLRFRAITTEQTQKLSQDLLPELAQVIGTAEDNFTFEQVPTEYFFGGKKIQSYPFVEVSWFARSQDIQDKTAAFITEKVKAITNVEDVIVVFQELEKTSYYENSKHF